MDRSLPPKRPLNRLVSLALASCLVLIAGPTPASAWSSSPDDWDAHDWILHEAVLVAEAHGFRWVDMEEASAASDDSALSETASEECDPSSPSHADPTGQVGSLFQDAVAAYEAGDFDEASRCAGRLAHLMGDLGDPYFAAGVPSDSASAEAYDELLAQELREAWRRNGWIPRSLPPYIVDPERAAGALRDRARARVTEYDSTASRSSGGEALTYLDYRPMAAGLADTVRMLAGMIAAVEVAAQPDVVVLERRAGRNRYETAAVLSGEAFPDGSRTVVVASGEAWPDALAASSLAGALDAPVLLTLPQRLVAETRAEIERLGATHAYVIGGTGAVSSAVEAALADSTGAPVTRLGGPTRYETALEVAVRLRSLDPGYSGEVLLCTGAEFPDALSASQIAARERSPVLLVRPGADPSWIPPALRSISAGKVLVVGGTGAVSAQVEAVAAGALGEDRVSRVGGADRYETAERLCTLSEGRTGEPFAQVAIARGDLFPDALAAGALAARTGHGLLLSTPERLHAAPRSVLVSNRERVEQVGLVGGYGALSPWIAFDVQRACDPSPTTAPERPPWVPPVRAHYTWQPDVSGPDVSFYYRQRAWTAQVLEETWPHDADGIVMVSYGDGPPVYNPTTIANYAIGLHEQFLLTSSGHSRWLFLKQADWLRDRGMDAEGRFLFRFYERGRGLENPWWSAMAQGQGISALVRAHTLTGDDSYLWAAERAFGPFQASAPRGVTTGTGDDLWLEEYPTEAQPTQVLNGSVFAMWGLWDLYRATGRADVKDVFDRAASTLARNLDDYDQDGIVLYERRAGSWAGGPYTSLQSYQLQTLTDITGRLEFADKADEWDLMLPEPE
jgi:putative cell wall-binding protein